MCRARTSARKYSFDHESVNMIHALRRLTAVRLLFWAALAALLTFSTANAADHVVFVTDFGLYGRHAYYFVAMDKGYYADETSTSRS